MTSRKRRRKLTKAELRALATPGLMVRCIGPDGRARVEQLAPESGARRKDFGRRLTHNGKSGEEGE